MARSSTSDPVEKFRFLVTIFQPSSAFIATNAGTSLVAGGSVGAVAGRAGFKEVSLPEAKVTTIRYRENIDGLSSRKMAGLVEYSPIVMKRGTMSDTQLFTLFTDTDNEASALNIFSSALASSLGALPFQNARYRKDLLISSLDRTGAYVKHWYVSNAFVTGYKGGNDLDALIDEKLMEEITFDYEFFIEVLGDSVTAALNNVSQAAATAAAQQAASKAASVGIGVAGSAVGSLF